MSELAGDDARDALETIGAALMPGRSDEVDPISRTQQAATLVLALPIEQWSCKLQGPQPAG